MERPYEKRGGLDMIKFKALYHLPTGSVITYDRWLESYKQQQEIGHTVYFNILQPLDPLMMRKVDNINKEDTPKKYRYAVMDLLTSDDFEILYSSSLTLEDWSSIHYYLHQNVYTTPQLLSKVQYELKKVRRGEMLTQVRSL